MYRRLLVPLDGSSLAEEALPHALNLARRFGSELVLLRVIISPYAIVAPDLVLAGTDPNLPELNQQAHQYLDSVATQLSGAASARTIVCEGPVAEAILEHAAALDVDLIIMSTHGRGGVSRWVYGSVAERVLQGSACPVLLIRSVAAKS
jgi:nucleotide-binding universal stress UspA family protein